MNSGLHGCAGCQAHDYYQPKNNYRYQGIDKPFIFLTTKSNNSP